MKALERWKYRAGQLKAKTNALYLACKDPRGLWYAKSMAVAVVGYALSPIDLIPDFIPVLVYLDDLLLALLGITMALKMIPPAILDECRERAQETLGQF